MWTTISRITRALLLITLYFLSHELYAGNGTWSMRIDLIDVSTSSPSNEYEIEEPVLGTEVLTHEAYRGRVVLDYDREERGDLQSQLWGFNYWKVKITYDLIPAVGSTQTNKTLTVSYENGNYVYSDFESFDPGGNSYRIQVTKIEGWKGNSLPLTTPMNVLTEPLIAYDLHIRLELDAEKGFEMLTPELPTTFYDPATTTLHWGYVEGAEWYDVEWLFLDAQSTEYADLSTATGGFDDEDQPSATLAAAFNLLDPSPSRVRVWGGSYKFDMIYPEGIVLFRVRAVGLYSGTTYGGMTDQVKPANWTYYNDAGSVVTHWVFEEIDGFEEEKNWSYSISFAESGKSVSSMSYYDGSMRGRQSLTYNTSDNVTLVGEAKFDYEGRQTVNILPAPVHGRSLGYKSDFNLAFEPGSPTVGITFDESGFDRPDPLELFAPTSGDGGAAQYFSAENNFPEDLFQGAIPHADGYVYSQTIYRNDGTGRIDRVSGVGEAFKADGAHTSKMYYATPTVTELKRLFGENVPDDLNGYRKTITRDANNQYSVSFYDKRGNVIATGLSGASPGEFRELEGNEVTEITTSLLSNNSLTADGLTLLAESTIFNEQEGTTTYDFTYDLGAELQQMGEICFTCAYKLEITILKPDLTVLYHHTEDINQPNPSDCEDPSNFDNYAAFIFDVDFEEVGEYRVIKKLTIDQETMNTELGSQVLANIGTLSAFLDNYTANLDYSSCYDNCDEFAEAMAIHKYNQNPSVGGADEWGDLTTLQQEGFIEAEKDIYCTTDGMEDVEDEDPGDDMTYTYALCNGYQHEMEIQVSPGGLFYDGPIDNVFWENVDDLLSGVSPPVFYEYYTLDSYGNSVGGGTTYVSYADLSNPDNFQEEWIPLFLPAHPEYCHLQHCYSMSESNEFDMVLVDFIKDYIGDTDMSTVSNALGTSGLLSAIYAEDDFITIPHAANPSNELETAIDNYLAPSSSLIDYVLTVVMPNYTTGITPGLSTLQLNQISVAAFAGMYMSEKQQVVDDWKAGASTCPYLTHEGAIFIPSQYTAGDLEDEIEESIAEWTSSNCIDQAVATVNAWMQLFSVECLEDLAAETPTALYAPPAAANPALYTYAELAGSPVRLEQYLYQYALSHCGEQFAIPFYDDGSAHYTNIQSIISGGTGCAISFEVTEPEAVTSDIVNQNIGGCLDELLAEINEHMLPPSVLGVGIYDYDIPSNTINCFPSGVTLTYNHPTYTDIDFPSGCKLRFHVATNPLSAQIDLTTVVSIEDPVKIIDAGASPQEWIRVTVHYSGGSVGYAYIRDNASCEFGPWEYVVNPVPDIGLEFPDWEADCLADILAQAEIDGTAAYWDLYNTMLAELQNNYINCLDVPESFDVTYDIRQYQYTLYYYDLVGNLVQTVPPQGVVLLNATQIAANAYPEHKMATRYGYNGLNAVTESYTPDGGHSQLYLDKLYRVRYSQSAQQVDDDEASYSKYDVLGRVTEAGEFKIPAGHILADKTEDLSYPTAGIMDYTHTYYDEGYTTDATIAAQFDGGVQENLRNAIGAVLHRQGDYDGSGYLINNSQVITVISYSYDPHKNVKQLVSTNYQLEGLGHQHKRVNYDYDLISGNVNEVVYQDGASDEYAHRYHYDANNRLIRAFTSKNGEVWEMDAKYFYYLHGAMARSETGHDKVQGTDYAYNLQGWLKGVNSGTLTAARDLGDDGHTSGLNQWGAVDAIGYQLGYYNGDYKSTLSNSGITSTSAFVTTTDLMNYNTNPEGWASSHSMASLYNGNISHMVSAIRKTDETVMDILGNNYQYDQLQRIRQMKVYYASGIVSNNTFSGAALYRGVSGESAYGEDYTFDKNGNLLTLNRHGSGVNDYGSPVSLRMDEFTYSYYTDYLTLANQTTGNTDVVTTKSNRLSGVADGVSSDAYSGDIATGQALNNYQYNLNGQLVTDLQEGIESIEWTVTGKVKKINFTTAAKTAGKHDVKFIYDPMDMRVAKVEYLTSSHSMIKYTYYTYDASGNVMATYDRRIGAQFGVENGYTDLLYLTDHTIYGSDRIGVENSGAKLADRSYTIEGDPETGTDPNYGDPTQYDYEYTYRLVGDKNYELSNHLGNVLAVITDRKIELGTSNIYSADVVSYSDYSPYGTMLPHRHGQAAGIDYRYGFQGQEADDEIKGEGNSYNYKYRMDDPRIGRFFAIDPLVEEYPELTPYQFSSNSPIYLVEIEGLEGRIYNYENKGNGAVYVSTTFDINLIQDVNRTYHKTNGKITSVEYKTLAGDRITAYSKREHYSAAQINRLANPNTSGGWEKVEGKLLSRLSQQSNSKTEGFLDGVGNFGIEVFENSLNLGTREQIDLTKKETWMDLGINTMDVFSGGKVTQLKSDIASAQGHNYDAGYIAGYRAPSLLFESFTLGVSFAMPKPSLGIPRFSRLIYESKPFGYNSYLLGIGRNGFRNGVLNKGTFRIGWGYEAPTHSHVLRIGIGNNPRFYPATKILGNPVHTHINLLKTPAKF